MHFVCIRLIFGHKKPLNTKLSRERTEVLKPKGCDVTGFFILMFTAVASNGNRFYEYHYIVSCIKSLLIGQRRNVIGHGYFIYRFLRKSNKNYCFRGVRLRLCECRKRIN